MTYHQPSRAPECCREPLCAHLDQSAVMGEPRDRCRKGIPMHPGCGWHATAQQIKDKNNGVEPK